MKASEIVEKSRKLFKTIKKINVKHFKIIKKYFFKSLGSARKHKIALIALFISIMGSSPITSRFLVYYSYKPDIWICLGSLEDYFEGKTTFNTSEIGGLSVLNNDMKRDLRIEIEFIASKPIKVTPKLQSYFVESGLSKGGNFRFRTKSFYLIAHSTLGLTYPFDLYYEKFTLEVIVYPKVEMSEFGLPRFFGDIDLRPIRKAFTVKP